VLQCCIIPESGSTQQHGRMTRWARICTATDATTMSTTTSFSKAGSRVIKAADSKPLFCCMHARRCKDAQRFTHTMLHRCQHARTRINTCMHHLHTQHHSSTIVSRGLTTLYPSPTDNENPTFIDPEHKPLISPSNKSATRLTIREHTP
jgi:hypothetical protein